MSSAVASESSTINSRILAPFATAASNSASFSFGMWIALFLPPAQYWSLWYVILLPLLVWTS